MRQLTELLMILMIHYYCMRLRHCMRVPGDGRISLVTLNLHHFTRQLTGKVTVAVISAEVSRE